MCATSATVYKGTSRDTVAAWDVKTAINVVGAIQIMQTPSVLAETASTLAYWRSCCGSGDSLTMATSRHQGEKTTTSGYQARQPRAYDRTGNGRNLSEQDIPG
jgi:hypothetical protein